MNQADIIRFGEQADETADRKIKMRGEYHADWHEVRDEAFAALVAAAEREACAQLCYSYGPFDGTVSTEVKLARAIRARGKP
jgi:hypothetical protein